MALQLLRTPEAAARWLAAQVSGTLTTDSRRVQPGDGFIAWPGYAVDGRAFVAAALQAGATPRMRRLCCTTWLNTGAATSPPK